MSETPERMTPSLTLQVALNGPGSHPRMPRTPMEIGAAAADAVAAGANAIHLHAFDDTGRETFEARFVSAVLREVRARCPQTPLNMTTFAEIEPDPAARLAAISGWEELPDLIPANLGEAGVDDIEHELTARGVRVEACLLSVADAHRLATIWRDRDYERVFVEPTERNPAAALATAAQIERIVLDSGCDLEQVHHGVGVAAWAVMERAAARGHGVRTGLEDTDTLPDGRTAPDNAALVREAARIVGLARREGTDCETV